MLEHRFFNKLLGPGKFGLPVSWVLVPACSIYAADQGLERSGGCPISHASITLSSCLRRVSSSVPFEALLMRFHSKWTIAGGIPVSSSHRIGSGLRLARIEEQSASMRA